MAALTGALIATGTSAPPAAALGIGGNSVYGVLTRNFTGVSQPGRLSTQGFVSDACLLQDVDCPPGPKRDRPEATAQAKTIRFLVGGGPPQGAAPPQGATEAVQTAGPVQWEVTGLSQSQCAVEALNRSDTLIDLVDLALPPTNFTVCPFRLDIVVDQGPGTNPGVIEVRRWRGRATRNDVNDRLVRYVGATGRAGQVKAYNPDLEFVRYSGLNDIRWVRGYQAYGKNWCVWADREVTPPSLSGVGNVYFSEYSAPAMDPTIKPFCTPGTVGITPKHQTVEGECLFNWDVGATMDPAQSRTLSFYFGDGTVEQQTVPQGTGTSSLTFSHNFGPPPGSWTQRASLDRSPGSPIEDTSDVTCSKGQPETVPVAQTVPAGATTSWDVTADPVLSSTRTVTFNFGDGSPVESRTVPAGQEPVVFLFQHTFASAGTFTQTATLVDTGLSSPTASTTVRSPSSCSSTSAASTETSSLQGAQVGSPVGYLGGGSWLSLGLMGLFGLWVSGARRSRRSCAVAFGVTAAALAFSSSAFACQTFRGVVTWKGNGNQCSTFTTIGGNNVVSSTNSSLSQEPHHICDNNGTYVPDGPLVNPGTNKAAIQIVSIRGGTTGECLNTNGVNKLAAGSYRMNWVNVRGLDGDIVGDHACHGPPDTKAITAQDFITVDSNGNSTNTPKWSKNFTVNSSSGYSFLCLWDDNEFINDAQGINFTTV